MKVFVLPNLTLKELQTFSEESLKIFGLSPNLNDAKTEVQKAFDSFLPAMQKVDVSLLSKADLDDLRDGVIYGFQLAAKSELLFPHKYEGNEEALKAIQELEKLLDKHGVKIKSLPYDQETAAVKNLMADISGFDFTPLADSGLARWAPHIERCNNDFANASSENNTKTAESSLIDSATQMAPALRNALKAALNVLSANLLLNATPELEKASAEMDVLIGRFR